MIPGLSLRAGDLLARHFRVTSLLRADRACAHLAACDRKTGTPVEVQVLTAMDDGLDPVRARFLAEAHKVAALRAPTVLGVLDVGTTNDGHPFIVREAPPGQTLASLLEEQHSLPTESAVDVALAVCEALEAAHAQGIVHGELSPHLVYLDWSPDGPRDVKLSNLGISRALAMLPLDARAMESLAISAPELLQAIGEPDARADIWGVGVLLYTMLAGGTPFASDAHSTQNLSVALDEPAMLAGVPEGLGDLVDACLARNPELRPGTMQTLASMLAPFGSRPVVAKPSPSPAVDRGPAREPAAASDKKPETTVAPRSVAPVAITISPPPAASTVTAAQATKPRASRTVAMAAVACVAVGILIGIGSTRLSSRAAPMAVQAAPPPPSADAPLPRIETPPANVATAVVPATAATDLPTVAAALPRSSANSPAKTGRAAAPIDTLVRSAAAPIHPLPKASDDDLRRFLDDRR